MGSFGFCRTGIRENEPGLTGTQTPTSQLVLFSPSTQSTRSTPSSSTSGSRPASLGYAGAAGPRPITQSELATALALASTPESSSHTPTPGTQVTASAGPAQGWGTWSFIPSWRSSLSYGVEAGGMLQVLLVPGSLLIRDLLLGPLLRDVPDVIQCPVRDTHHQRPVQPGPTARPAGLRAAQPPGQCQPLPQEPLESRIPLVQGGGGSPAACCGRT